METTINILVAIMYIIGVFGYAACFAFGITFYFDNKKEMLKYHKRMFEIGIIPSFICWIILALMILIRFTPTIDTHEYKKGYQDALNTKFEQRIDTVYYRKD